MSETHRAIDTGELPHSAAPHEENGKGTHLEVGTQVTKSKQASRQTHYKLDTSLAGPATEAGTPDSKHFQEFHEDLIWRGLLAPLRSLWAPLLRGDGRNHGRR